MGFWIKKSRDYLLIVTLFVTLSMISLAAECNDDLTSSQMITQGCQITSSTYLNITESNTSFVMGGSNFSSNNGAIVRVQSDDVIIDCNHNDLGFSTFDPETDAKVMLIDDSFQNITIKNCNFKNGIYSILVNGSVDKLSIMNNTFAGSSTGIFFNSQDSSSQDLSLEYNNFTSLAESEIWENKYIPIAGELGDYELTCNVEKTDGGSCSQGVEVMRMSNQTNAHAESAEYSTSDPYNWSVCCYDSNSNAEVTSDCSNSETVLRISNVTGGETNAHVEIVSNLKYPNDVCLGTTNETVSFRFAYMNDPTAPYCEGYDACVLSIGDNGTTDMHAGDCSGEGYDLKLCASLDDFSSTGFLMINATNTTISGNRFNFQSHFNNYVLKNVDLFIKSEYFEPELSNQEILKSEFYESSKTQFKSESGSLVTLNNIAADKDVSKHLYFDGNKFAINASAVPELNVSGLVSIPGIDCSRFEIFYRAEFNPLAPFGSADLVYSSLGDQSCQTSDGDTVCQNVYCDDYVLTYEIMHLDETGANSLPPVPEFSDYAMMLALTLVIGLFIHFRKR